MGSTSHVAAFAEYAANVHWTHIHLGQFAGMAVLIIGILALLFRLDRPAKSTTNSWSGVVGVGATLAVVSLGLYGVLQAVDGVALKQAVDAWVTALPAEKMIRFANAEAIRWLEWGIRSYQSFALGLTFLITGTLFAKAARPLRWIGTLMGLSRGAYIVQGGVLGSEGFSSANGLMSVIEIALVPAWSVGLLVVSWKHAAADCFIHLMKSLLGSHYEHVQHILKRTPATGIDPVCGMSIGEPPSGGQSLYDGHVYGFCSAGCKTKFDANPKAYVQKHTA